MTITAIEFVFLASGNMTDYSVGPSHWIEYDRENGETRVYTGAPNQRPTTSDRLKKS